MSSHRLQDSTLPSAAAGPHHCVGTTQVPSDNRSPSGSPRACRLKGEVLSPGNPQDPLGPQCNCGQARHGSGSPGEEAKENGLCAANSARESPYPNTDAFLQTPPHPPSCAHRHMEGIRRRVEFCPSSGACLPGGFESRSGKPLSSSLRGASVTRQLPAPPARTYYSALPLCRPGERTGLPPNSLESSRMLPAVRRAPGAHSCLVLNGSRSGMLWRPCLDQASAHRVC